LNPHADVHTDISNKVVRFAKIHKQETEQKSH